MKEERQEGRMNLMSSIALGASLLAVFVSFFALFVSKGQLEEQRVHNRLGVKPVIQFRRVQWPLPEHDFVGLYILNSGVGLAEVSLARSAPQGVFCPSAAREIVEEAEREQGLFGAWMAVLRARIPDLPTIHFASEVYAFVRPGEEICLVGVRAEQFDPAWEVELDRFLCELGLTVYYRSLYDEELVAVLQPIPSERVDSSDSSP